MIHCTKCGYGVPEGADFCHKCGSRVIPVPHSDNTVSHTEENKLHSEIDMLDSITQDMKPKPVEKITLGRVLSWIFGILFLLSAIGSFTLANYIVGVVTLLMSFVLLPPVNNFFKKSMNFELSGVLKVTCIILGLIVIGFAANTGNGGQGDITGMAVGDTDLHESQNIEQDLLESNSPTMESQNTEPIVEESSDKESENPNTDSESVGLSMEEYKEKLEVPSKHIEQIMEESSKEELEQPNEFIYSMGDTIKVDYLTYEITKTETFTYMGTSIYNKETNGKFVKVYLDITNDAKVARQIFSPRFRIEDNQGRMYDRLSDDMMYIADHLELGIQLQPGLTASGAIVFEMPKDSDDLKLIITGDWLSQTIVKVKLDNIRDIMKDTTQQEEQDRMWDEAMEEGEQMMDELMSQCNAPFKCTSSCPEYMDVGQKDCGSGQVCCMEG